MKRNKLQSIRYWSYNYSERFIQRDILLNRYSAKISKTSFFGINRCKNGIVILFKVYVQ